MLEIKFKQLLRRYKSKGEIFRYLLICSATYYLSVCHTDRGLPSLLELNPKFQKINL